MVMPVLRHSMLVFAGVLTLTLSGLCAAEPPSRVARLGYIDGTVSFSPAGEPGWVRAVVNRPLTTGDRLWADTGSRAELQVGGAKLRLGAGTSVHVLNVDDRIVQVQLSRGSLKVRVRRLAPNQVIEVDTPNLALVLRRPGEYRIDVDPRNEATSVTVQSGDAEVYGEGASYAVNPRQGYRFYGTGLSDYEVLEGRGDDELDHWARERDRRGENSQSARYVSSEVIGYEDLDANGTWRADPTYGRVWTPTRVASDWTPYRDGHWSWVDPWGWTWVDDAPWGFAVSHYGRWSNIRGRWSWVPGPVRQRAVYAPALVAFVGGKNFQGSVSVGSTLAAAVGWFPLAPREVYQPSYPVSRGYFDNINRSNAVIAPATITNVYNTTNVITNTTVINNTISVTNVNQVVYANQQVTGAVVAVPVQAFVQSQPVARALVPIPRAAALSAPVVHVAAVAPVAQSVNGGAAIAVTQPPVRVQAIVTRTAPPPPSVPFALQQKQLVVNQGKPITEAQRTQLKPAAVADVASKASIVTMAAVPKPAAVPPAIPPAGKSSEARKADAANADASRAEAAKAETLKGDAARTAAAKAEVSKAEAARADAATANAVKAEAAKAATAKADASKADASRAEAAKAELLKGETARAAAAKAEASKVEAAKADAVKAEAAKAAKAATAKTEASKADAARAETSKAEAAKAATAKADASKADAARAEAAKAATARADASKAEAAKAELSKGEAARVAAAKAEASKADAARAAQDKAEASRALASKAEALRAEASRAQVARANALKEEAAKAAKNSAAKDKAEASRAEASRAEAARAAAARAALVKPTVSSAPPPAVRASAPKFEPGGKVDAEKTRAEEERRKR